MFTTNSEFSVNDQLVIAHPLYDGQHVAIMGQGSNIALRFR